MLRMLVVPTVVSAALLLGGCPSKEEKAGGGEAVHGAQPVSEKDAGGAKAAAEPLPELPAAAELPAQPAGLPDMADSADNPTTKEKAALGYLLFFDKRLSKDD